MTSFNVRVGSVVIAVLLSVVGLYALDPEEARAATEGPSVVVVGLGEPLLAGEAEAFLESALKREGLRVVDERGVPEADAALSERQGPLSRKLFEALEPYAEWLVLVRAEYLGGRPLQVEQRSEVASQARLTVTVVDLGSDTPPESILNQRVEYTALTVANGLEKELRPCLHNLLLRLGVAPG